MIRCAIITLCIAALCSCDSNTLLEWDDPNEGIHFKVFKDPSIIKTNNYLMVGEKKRLIDDDAAFSHIRFLKIDGWLLILNSHEVWAGYHYETKSLFGEYDWDELPFTVHRFGGKIVAEKKVGGHGNRPANWPEKVQAPSE